MHNNFGSEQLKGTVVRTLSVIHLDICLFFCYRHRFLFIYLFMSLLNCSHRYDTLTNQWTFMAPMSAARASFGISVSDNRVYCVGGYNGVNYTNTVEKFNPRTNR